MQHAAHPARTRGLLRALCAAAVAALPHGTPAACPLAATDGTVLRGAGVELAFVTVPTPAAAHRPLRLSVRLCPTTATLAAVDATMPEHRHGMNYRPTLAPEGDGRWQVQGLLLHMAGRWELRFDVVHEGRRESLRHEVRLP